MKTEDCISLANVINDFMVCGKEIFALISLMLQTNLNCHKNHAIKL